MNYIEAGFIQGIITWMIFLLWFMCLKPHWKRRAYGHHLLVDLGCFFGVLWFYGLFSTGTIALVSAASAGVLTTIFLMIQVKVFHVERERLVWNQHSGHIMWLRFSHPKPEWARVEKEEEPWNAG